MDQHEIAHPGDDESSRVFIARQPILDAKRRVVAYELLFRDSATTGFAAVENPSLATARVAIDTLLSMGLSAVLGPHRGFLNVDLELLASEAIEALPADRLVLEILETVPPWALDRCLELKKLGFEIALDDFVPDDDRESMLKAADYVKVDLTLTDPSDLPNLVADLRRHPTCLLAEKVETNAEFENCLALGFELFQGYFFSKPTTLSGRKLEPRRSGLLLAFRAVAEDRPMSELQQVFKHDAMLGVQLLRIANSAALGSIQKIASFEHAVMYVGRRQLRRWILLMLYASQSNEPNSNAVLEVAVVRGRLLELTAPLLVPMDAGNPAATDRAFLVGMLSLSEVILGVKPSGLIEELQLEPEIGAAILEHRGPLGALLRVAEASEAGRFTELAYLLEALGLSAEQLAHAQSEAYAWFRQMGSSEVFT